MSIEKCDRMNTAAGCSPIAAPAILAEADRMAREGLRVIAYAYRRWPDPPGTLDAEQLEAGLIFIGLAGMMDTPRPEAAQSVALCRSAGITPVMVTGDHPATAQAIAARLGIASRDTPVLTGREMARLDPAAFADRVRDVRVYARVDPAQKIMIVEALQARGECVAMTGDGVNDAPAIKGAEIGIAMGRIGSARRPADLRQHPQVRAFRARRKRR
jgi:Ca2+-transporting ATPase